MSQTLTCTGDKKAADVIRKVITNKFEDQFKEIAASGVTFADAFAGGATGDEPASGPGLAEEIQAFRNCLQDAPVPVNDASESTLEPVPGDEHGEYMAKIHKQVMMARKSLIQFIPKNQLSQTTFRNRGGQATAL